MILLFDIHFSGQYCGLAPTLEYGYIVYASGVRGGDFIEYACRTGFTLIGNHHVLCYSNSTWGQLPKCMGKSFILRVE